MENINDNEIIIDFPRFSFFLSILSSFFINAALISLLIFIALGGNIHLVNKNNMQPLLAIFIVLVIMTIISWISVKHYVNNISISGNLITVKWQDKENDYLIEIPLNSLESTLAIYWGKGSGYTHLKLAFEHDGKMIELKQYLVGKWKIDTIKMVDEKIKEAQAKILANEKQ